MPQFGAGEGDVGLTDEELRATPVAVTGGGGGTEYTEGAVDATITGQAMLWEDAGDVLRPVSAAKPLPVSGTIAASLSEPISVDDNGSSLTVDGTVAVTPNYTEDAAAAANPVGFVQIARRRDDLIPVAETSADGDNVALNATDRGELYVKQFDPVAGTIVDADGGGGGANVFNATPVETDFGVVTRPLDTDSVWNGSVTAVADTLSMNNGNGYTSATVHWTQGSPADTFVIETSQDSVVWFQQPILYSGQATPWQAFQYTALVTLAAGEFSVLVNIAGWAYVRVRKTAGAGLDTFHVRLSRGIGFVAVAPPQGGLNVRVPQDNGRVNRTFMLDTYTAAPLVEALSTVVQWYNNAAVAGTTTPAVVPTGKRLRLTNWAIEYSSLATAGHALVRVRFNTGGTVLIGSPIAFAFGAGSAAAVAGVMTTETGVFPEGMELPAGGGIGFSAAGYNATGVLTLAGGIRFRVHGYEYTP